MRAKVTTEDVRKEDKLALWMDLVCAQLVQVDCQSSERAATFFGEIEKTVLPGLEIANIRANAQTVKRTKQQISCADDDCFLVNIQVAGSSIVRQDGREAILKPGDCAIYSSTRPYEFVFNESFRQKVVVLPVETVMNLCPGIDRQCAITLKHEASATALFCRMASTIDDLADRLPGHLAAAASYTLVQALVASVDGEQRGLTAYHLARAKDSIVRHLSHPDLDVEFIASSIGVSVSHLHRLFASEGHHVMRWVWDKRLEACSRDLKREKKISIASIAYRWGFSNPSHFSRAFRNRYGMSPGEWREPPLVGR
jgi:AraC-like DNA-binding protein